MDESYHGMLAEGVEKKMRELEVEIMKDVIRRVRKAGTITETADWQVQRLYILGNSSEDINKLINKAVYGDEEMVRKLYDEVIEREYTQQKEIYETSGNSFIPYEKNIELQQLIDAMVKQGTEDLFNITKSTGFVIPRGEGGRVFLPMAQMYNDYLDGAITGMVSGAYDYNTLVRKLVNQMTSSGLRTSHNFSDGGRNYGVDYMSGHHNRIDVAARRALLTGFSQVAGQVTEMNARKLGTNYFEVSWHGGARPDHAVWQGRVYSREELRTVCGLGEGGGLLGWNCRHSYYPFIPGISERQYSDEWLEQKAAEEAQVTVWRGKEYNTYQATQRQRQLETSMRAQRERVQLLREGGADPDDITIAQCKYQAILEEYRAFSSKMKLPTQMERVYTGRTPGRISPSPQTYAAWQAEQINKAKEQAEEKRRQDMRRYIRQSGGKHYPMPENPTKQDVKAVEEYRKISRTYDIDKIVDSSGMSHDEVVQIKRHVFYDKHKKYNGYGLLDVDYDMAVAWKRLTNGEPLGRDILLLKHELLEDQLEKEYNLSISEAHAMATKTYDWAKILIEETDGKGEDDDLL